NRECNDIALQYFNSEAQSAPSLSTIGDGEGPGVRWVRAKSLSGEGAKSATPAHPNTLKKTISIRILA
ncbi:MAG TPA: hypothetical protein PKK72_14525, partial [Chitinophagales bacterium]|nr:hypothetical protein [Chitinophagales bacterium]